MATETIRQSSSSLLDDPGSIDSFVDIQMSNSLLSTEVSGEPSEGQNALTIETPHERSLSSSSIMREGDLPLAPVTIMDKAAELPYKGNRDRASLLAWEDAWQKTLDDLYSEKKTFAQLTPSDAPLPCDLKLELDVDLRAAEVYALQFDVSEEIVKSMAMEDFEKHWLNTPAVHREAFILHGIAITAKGRKEIEPWRRWCPDGTLKVFAADDGRGFLELLRPFMLEDFTSISDSIVPVEIPHPIIDEILSLSKEDTENLSFILPVRHVRVERAGLLTLFIQNTIRAFVSTLLHRSLWF